MNTKLLHGILFLKGKEGITVSELQKILKVNKQEVKKLIEILKEEFISKNEPFTIKNFENIYWLSLSPEISVELAKNMKQDIKVRLTRSLVETLTIIAYNQPVVKSTIEKIRGTSADYALVKLLGYDLIEETGRDETKPGKPRTFITTPYFLMLFELKSLNDLPYLEQEFKEKTEEIQLLHYDDNDFSINKDGTSELNIEVTNETISLNQEQE